MVSAKRLREKRQDRIHGRAPVKVAAGFALASLGLMLLFAPGCQETRGLQRGGPAPAVHIEYHYRYYPDSAVYGTRAGSSFSITTARNG